MTRILHPVLVVEGESNQHATYERLLRRLGYGVLQARSARDGVAAVESERLSLVVTDLQLPDANGLVVVRAARQAAHPLPVIAITGFPSPGGRREALEAGASGYLVKPFPVDALTALVQDVLGRSGSES